MIEDRIESKIETKQHKKAFRKYRKPYESLIRHLNSGEQGVSEKVAALGRAAKSAKKTHGLTPYDVQLLSAIILMDGGVLEVSTGEGKTLVAALASCALALLGRKVHIFTPNDYLSSRDSEFTSRIASDLGLTCSYVTDQMDREEKKERFHSSDIVYTTERSVIFSYINDNSNLSPSQDILPTTLDFLIIDEADSILIDNGETPYILSGQGDIVDEFIPFLMPFARMLTVKLMDHSHYESFKANPKDCHAIGNMHTKDVMLLDKAYQDLEDYLLSKGRISNKEELYKGDNVKYIGALKTSLIALHTYRKDVNYVVGKDSIIVVDEHTGRMLPTVRMNSGIHQGIEEKEGVAIRGDNQTKGKITLEGFVAKYKTISGMSGTAIDVDKEMREFYNLKVYCIPNNKKPKRKDLQNQYFSSKKKKYKKMVVDIAKASNCNKPVLVGASSVEEAEHISELLKESCVKHVLLTPKHAEHEASVIAQAGRPGRVTVTTSMAGRGTDIVLGLNPENIINKSHTEDEKHGIRQMAKDMRDIAIDAGGLHVIGTERSRSPRVDRQLIGRSGRQGDPGSSQFYVSPDDNIFQEMGKNVNRLRQMLSDPDNPIVTSTCRRAIRKIQTDIRSYSIEQKKNMRKMYGVHEQQMHHYYGFRNGVKYSDDGSLYEWLENVLFRAVQQLVLNYVDYDGFDYDGINRSEEDLFYFTKYVMYLDIQEEEIKTGRFEETALNIYTSIMGKINRHALGDDTSLFYALTRETVLDACDECWVGNIARVEDVNKTIHFRSYAGEKPDIKYQQEALSSYKIMIVEILLSVLSRMAALVNMVEEGEMRDIA